MCDASVEFDVAGFDGFEDGVLAYEGGACFFGCFCCRAVFGGYYADSKVGFDGVWEAEAVSDYGAVFGCFEAEVEFVFG